MRVIVAVLAIGFLLSCSSAKKPDPIYLPILGTGSPAPACARMGELGCEEGLNAHCVEVLTNAVTVQTFDLECVARASSKDDVRRCGSIRCL